MTEKLGANILNIFDSQNENNVSLLPAQWLIVILYT